MMRQNAIDLQSAAPYRVHIHIYRHCNERLTQRSGLFRNMKKFAEAQRDSLATSYLQAYVQHDSFLDFGNDDPSFFFAAENGQSRLSCRVTQGICRKDLRRRAKLHDLTVFVCARETDDCNNWDYFLVGFGELIESGPHTDPRIARYLNRMLVKTDVKHIFKHAERMDRHIDWIHRVSDLRKAQLNSVLAATAMRPEHIDTRVIPVGSHYLVYKAQLNLWQPAALATTRQGVFRWRTRYAAFKALRKVIGKRLNEKALFYPPPAQYSHPSRTFVPVLEKEDVKVSLEEALR